MVMILIIGFALSTTSCWIAIGVIQISIICYTGQHMKILDIQTLYMKSLSIRTTLKHVNQLSNDFLSWVTGSWTRSRLGCGSRHIRFQHETIINPILLRSQPKVYGFKTTKLKLTSNSVKLYSAIAHKLTWLHWFEIDSSTKNFTTNRLSTTYSLMISAIQLMAIRNSTTIYSMYVCLWSKSRSTKHSNND